MRAVESVRSLKDWQLGEAFGVGDRLVDQRLRALDIFGHTRGKLLSLISHRGNDVDENARDHRDRDAEDRNHGHCAREAAPFQPLDHRVQQIGKNCRDSDRDQDRLKAAIAFKMSQPKSVTTAPMATNETAVTAAQNIFFWKGVGDIEGQLAEEAAGIQDKAPRGAEDWAAYIHGASTLRLGNFRRVDPFRAMTTIA